MITYFQIVLSGIYITKGSSNNEAYNNKIENVGYGLVANSGSNNNIFYSNTIEGSQISETFEDADSSGNVLYVSDVG